MTTTPASSLVSSIATSSFTSTGRLFPSDTGDRGGGLAIALTGREANIIPSTNAFRTRRRCHACSGPFRLQLRDSGLSHLTNGSCENAALIVRAVAAMLLLSSSIVVVSVCYCCNSTNHGLTVVDPKELEFGHGYSMQARHCSRLGRDSASSRVFESAPGRQSSSYRPQDMCKAHTRVYAAVRRMIGRIVDVLQLKRVQIVSVPIDHALEHTIAASSYSMCSSFWFSTLNQPRLSRDTYP